jgi:hypothetical protein
VRKCELGGGCVWEKEVYVGRIVVEHVAELAPAGEAQSEGELLARDTCHVARARTATDHVSISQRRQRP